jgi:hypothetical protein
VAGKDSLRLAVPNPDQEEFADKTLQSFCAVPLLVVVTRILFWKEEQRGLGWYPARLFDANAKAVFIDKGRDPSSVLSFFSRTIID